MTDDRNLDRYRGQWGGKIETGEEMWWSGVWPELADGSAKGRRRFARDPRHERLLSFFARVLPELGPRPKVIDFGCGAGGGTLNFSLYLKLPIEGFDIFPTQLEIARRQNAEVGAGCSFSQLAADGSLPLGDASVDLLFSSDVLGHVPNIPRTLRDWARVVRPGGYVVLFTEATYSEADQSIMARLSRRGVNMIGSVPEHISLLPREELEAEFAAKGFRSLERYSASAYHYPLNPKDYVTVLKDQPGRAPGWVRPLAAALHLAHKLVPGYPRPQEHLRSWVTRRFGREAFGCNYFYLLRRE